MTYGIFNLYTEPTSYKAQINKRKDETFNNHGNCRWCNKYELLNLCGRCKECNDFYHSKNMNDTKRR
jgi:hypothetical protein